ncbi:MAG: TetR/AcrR family transcriptional regulator [Eubacteriales bacterium]|nr:TetR/AcrR family transcriptional regulator [Eubacteriales bacterium]
MSRISDQRRFEILQAACEEFQSSGLQETSVADIARRADVGKSTIYEYYPSKEELVKEAGKWLLEQFLESLRDSFSGDATLTDKLCRYLDSFSALPSRAESDDMVMKNMIQFMNLVGMNALRDEMEMFQQESCNIIAHALSDAAARGEIPVFADAKIAAQMVMALLNPVSVGQLRRAGLENAAKEAVQTVLSGLSHR